MVLSSADVLVCDLASRESPIEFSGRRAGLGALSAIEEARGRAAGLTGVLLQA